MKAWVTLTLLLAGVAGGAERMTVSIEANAAPAVRDVADHLGTTLGWARGLNVTFETRPPRTPLARAPASAWRTATSPGAGGRIWPRF